MILLIDNYDSFVWNLARYVGELGHQRLVVRNDAIGLDDIIALAALAFEIHLVSEARAAAGLDQNAQAISRVLRALNNGAGGGDGFGGEGDHGRLRTVLLVEASGAPIAKRPIKLRKSL